jgi:hypothetical protein
VNVFDRYVERYFAPAKGAIREFVGISAVVEPADLALYRRLLPEPFDQPARPLVSILAIDYLQVAPWPLRRWQEWGVLLRCAWQDGVGWHPVTMPVTRWLPMSAGRYLGYPKYVADSISLTRDGDRWQATATHRGVRQLGMTFEPGLVRQPELWEADPTASGSPFSDEIYLLAPPGKGPAARRVSFAFVEAHWSSQLGTVRLETDEREAWAGLLPAGGSCPGAVSHFVGGYNIVAERLPLVATCDGGRQQAASGRSPTRL